MRHANLFSWCLLAGWFFIMRTSTGGPVQYGPFPTQADCEQTYRQLSPPVHRRHGIRRAVSGPQVYCVR
jgi:hypothetical protein